MLTCGIFHHHLYTECCKCLINICSALHWFFEFIVMLSSSQFNIHVLFLTWKTKISEFFEAEDHDLHCEYCEWCFWRVHEQLAPSFLCIWGMTLFFAWLHLTSSFDIFYPSCLCIGASKGHFFQHAEYVFNPINFGLHFVSFCFYNCILWQLHLIYGVIILFIVKTNH